MNASDVGGIDLNPANFHLQIKRDGKGVALPVGLQDIEHINIKGFIPVIINIIPVTNLPQLLGMAGDDPNTDGKSAKGSSQEVSQYALRLAKHLHVPRSGKMSIH